MKKRKIGNIILGAAIFILQFALLSGCSIGNRENQGGINSDNNQSESLIEDLKAENPQSDTVQNEEGEGRKNIDSGSQTESGTEKNQDSLEEKLRPCIVEIICGGHRGSGIVWEITEEEVIILSVGHLLKNADTCDVLCYKGIYYTADVAGLFEEQDIGAAVFSVKDLAADQVELTAVNPGRRTAEEMMPGEDIFVYGSKDYVAGNFVKGFLIEAEAELELPVYGEKRALLLGGTEAELKSIDAGMSGSGVFDKDGNLAGILVGGDDRGNFGAVPIWKIESWSEWDRLIRN